MHYRRKLVMERKKESLTGWMLTQIGKLTRHWICSLIKSTSYNDNHTITYTVINKGYILINIQDIYI